MKITNIKTTTRNGKTSDHQINFQRTNDKDTVATELDTNHVKT